MYIMYTCIYIFQNLGEVLCRFPVFKGNAFPD